jgi:hypothetical protein
MFTGCVVGSVDPIIFSVISILLLSESTIIADNSAYVFKAVDI